MLSVLPRATQQRGRASWSTLYLAYPWSAAVAATPNPKLPVLSTHPSQRERERKGDRSI